MDLCRVGESLLERVLRKEALRQGRRFDQLLRAALLPKGFYNILREIYGALLKSRLTDAIRLVVLPSGLMNRFDSLYQMRSAGLAFPSYRGGGLALLREAETKDLILTAAHEIGHLASPCLTQPWKEEAKAIAFELGTVRLFSPSPEEFYLKSNYLYNPNSSGNHLLAAKMVRAMLSLGMTPGEAYLAFAG